MKSARLHAGDRIRFEAQPDGRILVTPLPARADLSRFIGLWRAQGRYGSGKDAIDDLRGTVEP